jgi:hypothetical protein
LEADKQKLKVQLRASTWHAPKGQTFWSMPVQLDAFGGAAVVSVPCPPSDATTSRLSMTSLYVMSVTASQVNAKSLLLFEGLVSACLGHSSEVRHGQSGSIIHSSAGRQIMASHGFHQARHELIFFVCDRVEGSCY